MDTNPPSTRTPSSFSYNKYTQIASRAVRTGLKESERVGAEKRANIGVKYQQWENGKGGEQVSRPARHGFAVGISSHGGSRQDDEESDMRRVDGLIWSGRKEPVTSDQVPFVRSNSTRATNE